MENEKLGKELVENPQNWRLSMEISDQSVEVVAYSPTEQDAFIYRRLPMPETSTSPLAALGDVVYDNTLLLSEFSTTDVLIDTPRFIIAPTEMCAEGMDSAIISAIWPNEKMTVVSHPIVGSIDTMLAGVDTKMISFIRRTFPTATIRHRLVPLLSYLITNDHEVGTITMYVNVHGNRIDVIYFNERGLYAVNTYDTPTPEDMLYYIMNTAKGCNMNINKDDMVICGNPEEAEQLRSFIRKYARTVLTMDAPYEVAALGSGAPYAPLELTLLPLCV